MLAGSTPAFADVDHKGKHRHRVHHRQRAVKHRPGCRSRKCDHRVDRHWAETHKPKCRWVRTGATLDPTRGQWPFYSDHGGYSFAELLEAGSNAGLRPDLTQLLGFPRRQFGMAMETSIRIRNVHGHRSWRVWKNDVGSGQGGLRHYTIDLHPAIASALGFGGTGDVEVARC